jgi:hypothetical protein
MTNDTWGIVSGFVALAIGVFALLTLATSEPAGPSDDATVVESSPLPVSPASTTPDVPGVPDSVDRALHLSGDARVAGDEELAQLPSTVAAVLIEYGVPLRVALPEGG